MTPIASPLSSVAMLFHISVLIAYRLYVVGKYVWHRAYRSERKIVRRIVRGVTRLTTGVIAVLRPAGGSL